MAGRGKTAHGRARTYTDRHGQIVIPLVRERPCPSITASALAANAALPLLNRVCHLLDRRIASQAESFEKEGGFTERLYRVRTARRKNGR